TEEDVRRLNAYLQHILDQSSARIEEFYYCPHHPQGKDEYRKECFCRKPRPGLLLKAAKDYETEMKNSYIIGDKISDLEAGLAVGVKPILVLTGYGLTEVLRLPQGAVTKKDLLAASRFILNLPDNDYYNLH
ncbi:MAG: HAD-IIIA family hydrolase, partial [Firmicutes bacterium]|nr:HAD-IIIA family hydrolase [Bacillota bacterium]